MHTTHSHKHHFRFYIVMITVVLGVIFYLLVTNNNLGTLSLTGSSVGVFDNSSEIDSLNKLLRNEDIEIDEEDQPIIRGREVDTVLSFDHIPIVEREAKITELEVRFLNSDTKIEVNDDLLEMGALEEINLRVNDFVGTINFDSLDFSLEGIAERIEVNGVAFSSKEDLSISLGSVEYQYLFVDEIELKNVEIPRGNGQLELAEKLSYELEEEELTFHNFIGKIIIDQEADSAIEMEGIARGVDIEGALLSLGVR